jgi:nucleotide-binding universal stress UspA family protein
MDSGGRILLLHVVEDLSVLVSAPDYSVAGADVFAALREVGAKVLADCESKVRQAGVPVETKLFENLDLSLCQRVLRLAEEWQADLVVIGTHGRRGVRRLVLGSDAEQIVRTSVVPVLLVRAPGDASSA